METRPDGSSNSKNKPVQKDSQRLPAVVDRGDAISRVIRSLNSQHHAPRRASGKADSSNEIDRENRTTTTCAASSIGRDLTRHHEFKESSMSITIIRC